MTVYALRKSFERLKSRAAKPAILATLPAGQVEIDPADLMDCFIDAIRAGELPRDHYLAEILSQAAEDKSQGLIFECLRKLAQGLEPVPDEDLILPRGKQAASILNSTRRLNIWYGSVRSSKTVMSCIRWLQYCLHGPKGHLMMIGQTLDTLELNVIEVLKDLLPAVINYSHGWVHCMIFGRKVRLRSANSRGEEKKLRGPTLAGLYGDELTTWPKEIFKMAQNRISKSGAALFGTTNPDSPFHWLKTDLLDRAEDLSLSVWHFLLDDNPGISAEYVENLKKEYMPGTVYYLRFILGLWVAAEGRIYSMFDLARHVIRDLPKAWSEIVVGVDFGAASVTSYIMLGRAADGPYAGKWIAWREYYNDASRGAQKTTFELASDMEVFLAREGGIWHPRSIEVDPSASPLKIQFRRKGFHGVHDAFNDVKAGIMTVASALTSGSLLIHESCHHLLEEIQTYTWDPKAQERGEDKPIKQNDHLLDSLRYACARVFRHGFVP